MTSGTDTQERADGEMTWILACRGTFLEVLPDFDADDAPRRPPRAASVPAGMGRPRHNLAEAAMQLHFEDVLRRQQLSKSRDSRDGPQDLIKTASMMTTSTMCPDDDDDETAYDLSNVMKAPTTQTTTCADDVACSDGIDEPASDGSTATAMCLDGFYAHGDSARMPEVMEDRGPRRASDAPDGSVPPSPSSGSRGKTLMLRNIPCRIDHDGLVKIMEEQGFSGRYDFVYVPLSHRPKANIGYAFVNLIDEEDEDAVKLAFNGFRFPGTTSQKVCEVQPAKVQGLAAQLLQRRRARLGKHLG